MTLAEKIISFYSSLELIGALPKGIEVMNPYKDSYSFELCKQFYYKYYSDNNPRTMILGINPGRFGGGITGIPFTDPVKLEKMCGIPNNLAKKTELSADFIYQMIEAYGGPEKFYGDFYISALSPLGFTKDGKNLNYYDSKELQEKVYPFMVASLQAHLAFGMSQDICFCLGEGQNFKFFAALNTKLDMFKKIVPLSHPRFIMQYRRKHINRFIKDYLNKFRQS